LMGWPPVEEMQEYGYEYEAFGNALLSVTTDNGTEIFTYNSMGDMETRQQGDELTTYLYDSAGRLKEVRTGEDIQAQYEYDAYGRLVKTEDGKTTIRLPLGNETAYEKVIEQGNPTTERKYIIALNRYLARDERTGQGSWQRTYYHQDHLGSTRALSGIDSGTLAYEPFGSVLQDTGSTEEHRHRFTGKSVDGTGLYYYGARFYDSRLGRFISIDPARDGLNWYVYAANNPLKYIDPDGMAIWLSNAYLLPMLQQLTDDSLAVSSEGGYVAITKWGWGKRKPAGTALIRFVISHWRTIKIETTFHESKFEAIHRSGGTIYLNEKRLDLVVTGNVDTLSGTLTEMPIHMVLGHELVHAWRWLSGGALIVPEGARGERIQWTWKLGEEEYTRWQSREELETIGLVKPSIGRRLRMLFFVPTENAMRFEHGLDPRISYMNEGK
ncbi:MAG: M91 family zinc metallopeptidase, partial [Limnochordia bacterium]|nr:M91 family zinc metallopeptidase [Limnochordia bacterium]